MALGSRITSEFRMGLRRTHWFGDTSDHNLESKSFRMGDWFDFL